MHASNCPHRTTDDRRPAIEFDGALRDLLDAAARHHRRRMEFDPAGDLTCLSESRRRLDAARRRAVRLGRRLGATPVEPHRVA